MAELTTAKPEMTLEFHVLWSDGFMTGKQHDHPRWIIGKAFPL